MPYHVVLTDTKSRYGVIFNILYVGRYKEDWELENRIIESSRSMAIAVNMENDEYTDVGIIGLSKEDNGLIRKKDW